MREQIKQKKYERVFIIATSIFVTFVNNLPYYSFYFYSNEDSKGPEQTLLESVSKISWYTLQCFISILLLAFINYYLMKVVYPKISKSILKYSILTILNLALSVALFKLTYFLAGQTIGYPFGERWTINFYIWKYINITPLSILIAYILNLIIRKRTVESKNERLKQENLSNQLKTLKDQIKPHFLFNTLNTLSSIIRNDSRESGLSFVNDLAIVYRYILEKSNDDVVKISDELDFAISYIRILKKRFYNAVNFSIDIPERYKKYNILPSTMLLLVENALKHNEFSNTTPLTVDIFVDGNFVIVQNNIQKKETEANGLGIGLQNLNLRYAILTNREIIINKNEGLFSVRLPIIK